MHSQQNIYMYITFFNQSVPNNRTFEQHLWLFDLQLYRFRTRLKCHLFTVIGILIQ